MTKETTIEYISEEVADMLLDAGFDGKMSSREMARRIVAFVLQELPTPPKEPLIDKDKLRESIIHGLRSKGWSRIEAENEADERVARAALRARASIEGTDNG